MLADVPIEGGIEADENVVPVVEEVKSGKKKFSVTAVEHTWSCWYHQVRRLGGGTFGEVILARVVGENDELGEEVAVKIMEEKHFVQEAEAIALVQSLKDEEGGELPFVNVLWYGKIDGDIVLSAKADVTVWAIVMVSCGNDTNMSFY